MKNNKVTQAVMLVFVLAVWGGIFYKIYDKLNDDSPAEIAYDLPDNKMSMSQVADTFRLLANYNDPFEHQAQRNETHADVARTSGPPARPVVKAVAPAAAPVQVKYLGMIKNNASKKRVALMSINGKSSLMQENESVEGLKLLKLFKDSVEVIIDRKKTFIRK